MKTINKSDIDQREFLLDLFERFGKSDAQAALDFVRKNTVKEKSESVVPEPLKFNHQDDILPNGVYYVLKNGDILFTCNCLADGEEVDFIGIAHDGHTFGVPLDGNLGKHKLLPKDNIPKDDHCVCECEALLDWDFVRATNHIKELGSEIPLKDGQYLPTAAVWLAMYAYKEQLNHSLTECGAEPIDFSDDYWFAQRYSVHNAWFFYGYVGHLGTGGVPLAYACRAVTLWNPNNP